jgi:multicomponent Na+:H+ antiporter subunit E
VIRAVSLGCLLLVIWLLLSGHYTLLITGFGILSCVLVVFIALRMDVVDEEGHPLQLVGGLLFYLPWLALQVIKANIAVMRVILNPRLPIHPQLIRFRGSQETDIGRAIYANSITLTPGTITTGVVGHLFEVHALTQEARDGTEEGEMDRRVARLDARPRPGAWPCCSRSWRRLC